MQINYQCFDLFLQTFLFRQKFNGYFTALQNFLLHPILPMPQGFGL